MEIKHFEIRFGIVFFFQVYQNKATGTGGLGGPLAPHVFPRFDKVVVRLSAEVAQGLLLLALQIFLASVSID